MHWYGRRAFGLRSKGECMLHEFLLANHDELEKRCRAKSAARVDGATSADSVFGVPWFITQLVAELRAEQGPASERAPVIHLTNAASSAGQHGKELLNKGFTVDQVVH